MTTGYSMLEDIEIRHPTMYFINFTVFLSASMPGMYLGKRRNEYRNFSGGPLEKTHLGD